MPEHTEAWCTVYAVSWTPLPTKLNRMKFLWAIEKLFGDSFPKTKHPHATKLEQRIHSGLTVECLWGEKMTELLFTLKLQECESVQLNLFKSWEKKEPASLSPPAPCRSVNITPAEHSELFSCLTWRFNTRSVHSFVVFGAMMTCLNLLQFGILAKRKLQYLDSRFSALKNNKVKNRWSPDQYTTVRYRTIRIMFV